MIDFLTKRFLLLIAIATVVIFSLTGALIYQAATGPRKVDQYPLDKACYSLIDQSGREYKSWFPPLGANDAKGVYVFNNDHTWGYVFGPIAMVADRDCLRERYPGDTMVPVLEGSDSE